jgi:hypothetical protein
MREISTPSQLIDKFKKAITKTAWFLSYLTYLAGFLSKFDLHPGLQK